MKIKKTDLQILAWKRHQSNVWCFCCWLLTYFILYSTVIIVEFEQVNASSIRETIVLDNKVVFRTVRNILSYGQVEIFWAKSFDPLTALSYWWDLKKLNPIVSELFLRGRKINISLVFISQSYLKVPKTLKTISHIFL